MFIWRLWKKGSLCDMYKDECCYGYSCGYNEKKYNVYRVL